MRKTGKITTTLHVLRAERRWSQQQVADALGISRQTIVSIEAGRYNPSLLLAYQLASLFGKQIDDIFTYEPFAE